MECLKVVVIIMLMRVICTFLSPYDIKADWLMAHYSGSQLFVFAQRLHIPHSVVKLEGKKSERPKK